MTGIEWEGSDKAASGSMGGTSWRRKRPPSVAETDAFAIDGSADLCTFGGRRNFCISWRTRRCGDHCSGCAAQCNGWCDSGGKGPESAGVIKKS